MPKLLTNLQNGLWCTPTSMTCLFTYVCEIQNGSEFTWTGESPAAMENTVVDHSGSLTHSRACKSQDIQVSPHRTIKCSGLLTPHAPDVKHNYELHYYCLRPFRRFRMVITSSSRSTSTSAKRRLIEEYRSRISRNSPSNCLTRFRSPTRSLTTVSTSPKFWSATAWTFCCSANALIPGQKSHKICQHYIQPRSRIFTSYNKGTLVTLSSLPNLTTILGPRNNNKIEYLKNPWCSCNFTERYFAKWIKSINW